MDPYSFLNTAHTAYFAELYDQYLINPESVETCFVPLPYETLADCTIDVSSPI